MGMRNIMKLGDDSLRKVCKPMQKFDLRLWLLLRDMADTMYKANGVGLAAPQVGILRRVVVVDIGDGLIELINPEIIAAEGEQEGPEGCLSLPGRQGFVRRPNKVTVRAQDRNGKPFEITGEGFRPGLSAMSWIIWTAFCTSTRWTMRSLTKTRKTRRSDPCASFLWVRLNSPCPPCRR